MFGAPFMIDNFYVPANAEVVISLLNPDAAGTPNVQANVVLEGHYLEVRKQDQAAGVEIGFKDLPPQLADRARNKRWGNLLG